MSRLLFALALFGLTGLTTSPAEAARLVHPSKTAKSVEKGVAVWRGPAAPPAAAPAAKAKSECAQMTVVVERIGFPPRRLTTRGFWSGEGYNVSYGVSTRGFYADRIAAGL